MSLLVCWSHSCVVTLLVRSYALDIMQLRVKYGGNTVNWIPTLPTESIIPYRQSQFYLTDRVDNADQRLIDLIIGFLNLT